MKALTLNAEWAPKPGYEMSASERELRRPRNGNMTWKSPALELGDVPDPSCSPIRSCWRLLRSASAARTCTCTKPATDGYMIYPGLVHTPNILGHEYAGRIVEARRGRERTCKSAIWSRSRRFSGAANAPLAGAASSITA